MPFTLYIFIMLAKVSPTEKSSQKYMNIAASTPITLIPNTHIKKML